MIRVAIVADSPIHRAGLASVLGADAGIRIVAGEESRDGDEDVDDAPMREADVVIVVPRGSADVSDVLPSDGSDLDERFRGPATMVLVERLETSSATDAYAAGASAVLPIDASAEELRAAVHAIAAGLVVLPIAVSAEIFASTRRSSPVSVAPRTPTTPLTSREREVLGLLAQGFANKVIAARLGITEHTVKTHVAAVYEKLSARNRAEVLVAAARQGLVML